MSERLHGVPRHLAILAGVVLAGWAGAAAVPFMIGPNGAFSPSVLHAQSPIAATLALLACAAAGTIVAAVVARLTNAAVGLFVLGAGLWVVSFRTGTIEDLALSEHGSLVLVGLETALWSVVLLVCSAVVFIVSGPLRNMQPPRGEAAESWFSITSLQSAAFGVLIVPGVWLIARTHGKGQVVAAVMIGAGAAGVAARIIRPFMQPVLLFAVPCLVGGIMQIVAARTMGQTLEQAFMARTLSPYCLPMPIDFAAGALLGVSMGLGFAHSMLHPEPTTAGAPATASKAPVVASAPGGGNSSRHSGIG